MSRRPTASINLRHDDIKALDVIAELHGLSRPAVVRLGLARLASDPPSNVEIAATDIRALGPTPLPRAPDPTPEEISEACEEYQNS